MNGLLNSKLIHQVEVESKSNGLLDHTGGWVKASSLKKMFHGFHYLLL